MKNALHGLIIVLASGMSSMALAEASYEETTQFIYGKGSGLTTLGNRSKDRQNLDLTSERCKLKIVGLFAWKDDSSRWTSDYELESPSYIETRVVDLAEIDPSRTEIGKNTVYFETRERKEAVRVLIEKMNFNNTFAETAINPYGFTCTSEVCEKQYYDSSFTLRSIDPLNDNLPRLAKAMNHLVRLCGGKEELF